MRKFQYILTVDLDDKFLEDMVKEDPSLIEGEGFEGLSVENFIPRFAEKLADPITEKLKHGLGDAGKSKVKTVFGGEVK